MNLNDAHGGAFIEVEGGTLVLEDGVLRKLRSVRVGGEGTLEVRTYYGSGDAGLAVATDVASGATVRREAKIYPGEAVHAYKLESGRRTEFQLLRAEGYDLYEAGFAEVTLGATISDVIELELGDEMKFVLQIGFDAEAMANSLSDLRLGWFDGAEWINAILGNSGDAENFVGFTAWDGEFSLGDWGVDAEAGTVWAVLDHGGQFAVIAVPEVATGWLLLSDSSGWGPWAGRETRDCANAERT